MNTTLKLSVAASLAALVAMTDGASTGIISDQTQLVADEGTVQLIVDQLNSNTYQATLIWARLVTRGALPLQHLEHRGQADVRRYQ